MFYCYYSVEYRKGENVLVNLLNPGIQIFGFTIYYYAIILVSGILAATCLSGLMMKRRNISSDLLLIFFIICIPCAIVGARVYYCITDNVPLSEWINTRNGGMSILGGLIGGIGSGFIVCLIKKVNFLRVADCVLPTVPLAQAIGRWGNFVNGEVYGQLVTNEALQWFPMAVKIGSEWHYALFFYESVINFVWFIVLYRLAWKKAYKPNGIYAGAFVAFYGIVRTIMEPLRDSEFILGGTDHMYSRITSIMMIVGGIAFIVILLVFNKKKEGKFIGSKTGDPYTIGEFIPCDKTEEPNYDKLNLAAKLYHKGYFEKNGNKKGESGD